MSLFIYHVTDGEGPCAGNLRLRQALGYAEGRSRLYGQTCVVWRRTLKGGVKVAATFVSPGRLKSV